MIEVRVLEMKLKKSRCPRCGGWLYGAEYRYHPKLARFYKNVLHCGACGRDWNIFFARNEIILSPYAHMGSYCLY